MSSPENTFITFRGALRKLLSSLLLKCFHGLVVRSRAKVVLYPWGVRIYCFCWLFGRRVSLLVVKKKKKKSLTPRKKQIFSDQKSERTTKVHWHAENTQVAPEVKGESTLRSYKTVL